MIGQGLYSDLQKRLIERAEKADLIAEELCLLTGEKLLLSSFTDTFSYKGNLRSNQFMVLVSCVCDYWENLDGHVVISCGEQECNLRSDIITRLGWSLDRVVPKKPSIEFGPCVRIK